MTKLINNKLNLECKLCSSSDVVRVFKYQDLPLYNLNYLNTQKGALKAKKADVDFVLCHSCGFLFNSIYNQLSYEVDYNADRSNSYVFNKYLNDVVKFVVSNIDLNKVNKVVEVGVGDFKFASSMKASFMKNIIYNAYDPSLKESGVDITHSKSEKKEGGK